MDNRAVAAREAHRLSLSCESEARRHRDRRDAFIRRLHEDGWSYTQISRSVKVSKALVAVVVRKRKVNPGG